MTFSERRGPQALVLAAAAAFALAGCGTGSFGIGMESAEDSTDITEPITAVRFDVRDGDVRIAVQPGDKATVQRRISYRGQRPKDTFRMDNGTLVLDGCPDSCSVDYQLTLPYAVKVSGNAGTGTVDVTGAAGLEVTADVGNVAGRGITGPAKIDAKVGAVNLTFGTAADATVVAGAGSVNVTVPAGSYQVQAKARAGKTKIDVPSDPAGRHKLDLVSHSSNVTVSVA